MKNATSLLSPLPPVQKQSAFKTTAKIGCSFLCIFVSFVAIHVFHFSVLSLSASATVNRPSPFTSSCLSCSVVPRNSLRDRSPSLFLSMLVNQLGAVGAAG